jgi:hypothetical protein
MEGEIADKQSLVPGHINGAVKACIGAVAAFATAGL